MEKMGIVVGYSHPHMTVIPENVEYVICETEDVDDDGIQLLHREDLRIDWIDESTIKISPGEEPQNDHLVKEFLAKITNGLVDGILWFDPGVTRTVDGMTLKVTKKSFNDVVDQDAVFDTNIVGPNMTTMYKYSQICLAANMDRRFKALKQVIDSNWPEVSQARADTIREYKEKQETPQEQEQEQEQGDTLKIVFQAPDPEKEIQKNELEQPEFLKYLLSYFKNWLKSKL